MGRGAGFTHARSDETGSRCLTDDRVVDFGTGKRHAADGGFDLDIVIGDVDDVGAQRVDLAGDRERRVMCLNREVLDFPRDDPEPEFSFPGTRCFDRSVERK